MTELTVLNNKVMMTSVEIAELTGKQHAHVMRDARNMESAYTEVYGGLSKFGLSSYLNNQNKEQPMFSLTKSQVLFIVSGYNAVLRAKIQHRWEELEAMNVASYQIQDPIARAEAWIEEQKVIKQLEEDKKVVEALSIKLSEKVHKDAPKVKAAEVFLDSKGSMTIAEFAKTINTENIGQNRMFAILRELGFLMSSIGKKNEPYQAYINNGMFEVRRSTYSKGMTMMNSSQTMITPFGASKLNIVVKSYLKR